MFKERRVRFCKRGTAVYFSHLDLNRAVMRALRRSGVPFWSTGGFSPHPYCIFAQPLSLGFESEGELFDFRLLEGAAMNRQALAEAFPEALKVLEIYEPRDAFKEIAYAGYEVDLKTDGSAAEITRAFAHPLMIVKKTKRSEQTVDLRAFVREITVSTSPGAVRLQAVIAAGNERNLSPNYLAEGLRGAGFSVEFQRVLRRGFYRADGTAFR